jgi:hypothetical protein
MGRLHAASVRTFWTTVGNGVAPLAGFDTVAGDVVIDVAPAASTFELRYGHQSQVFSMWGAPAAVPGPPTDLVASVVGSTVGLTWTPTGHWRRPDQLHDRSRAHAQRAGYRELEHGPDQPTGPERAGRDVLRAGPRE